MVRCPFNLCYIIDFSTAYIVFLLLFGIANIIIGTYLLIKYHSDNEPSNTENAVENEEKAKQLVSSNNSKDK